MKLKERLCDWRCWIALILFVLFAIVPMFGCAQIYHPKEEPLYIDPLNYDRGRNCLSYSQNDEEWRWCMDPDNDHIYDPYYQQRQDVRMHRKELFKEKLKIIALSARKT